MTPSEITQRVTAVLEAWKARDLDGFLSFMTPDVYWHDLGMPFPPAVGHAAVRKFSETTLVAFPDFQFKIRGPICVAEDGNSCVLPWTISATNLGPFDPPGFAPTGRAVHFSGLDYLVFRDGLVARIETRFDPAEVVEQMLGLRLRPVPGSLLERCLVLLQRMGAAILRRRNRRSVATQQS
jgi:predicted ester cyclase